MNLSNAYELRDQLTNTTLAAELSSISPASNISVGVAYGNGAEQYKLAVRVRRPDAPLTARRREKFKDLEMAETRYSEAANEFRQTVTSLVPAEEIDWLTTGPVRTIGVSPVSKAASTGRLAIGASVGHKNGGGGTLGFFARRDSKSPLGFVSNNHVIALEDQACPGDEIIHPAAVDGGSARIGTLAPYPQLGNGATVHVDCAFAVLDSEDDVDLLSLDGDAKLVRVIGEPHEYARVKKIGRTTKVTSGRIRGFGFKNVAVHTFRFDNAVNFTEQIEIESATRTTFSDPGDSGSLVYNERNQPVGLLFAETSIDGRLNLGLHYANPIAAVLSALKVSFA